jgi:hypothetical protein
MILYLDTFITDSALFPNAKMDLLLNKIRPINSQYKHQSKVDIFKYTIDSYLNLNFDEIIFNVEFENGIDKENFSNTYSFDKRLKINYHRSDTKIKYLNNLRSFNKESWCLFSPNNDHPYVSSDKNLLNKLESYADVIEERYSMPTSIFYSHFTEILNLIYPNDYLNSFKSNRVKYIEENDDAYVVEFPNLHYSSIQILKVKYLIELLEEIPENNPRIIRLEDISKYINIDKPVISLIPKSEICRHYDTYIHTIFHYFKYIKPKVVPPLFIPTGFFSNDIKIKYGYDRVYNNYININPNKSIYSFEDPENGFDMLCELSELPQSWENRISTIEINDNFKLSNLNNHRKFLAKYPWGNNFSYYKNALSLFRNIFNERLYKYCIFKYNNLFWRNRINNFFK